MSRTFLLFMGLVFPVMGCSSNPPANVPNTVQKVVVPPVRSSTASTEQPTACSYSSGLGRAEPRSPRRERSKVVAPEHGRSCEWDIVRTGNRRMTQRHSSGLELDLSGEQPGMYRVLGSCVFDGKKELLDDVFVSIGENGVVLDNVYEEVLVYEDFDDDIRRSIDRRGVEEIVVVAGEVTRGDS